MTPVAAPLAGLRIVVTRSREQAGTLTERLRALGAIPIEVPMIRILPPADGGAALRAAVAEIVDHSQVAVASPNGARALLAAVEDAPDGPLPPVACVGPSTAAVFEGSRLDVNVVAGRALAEGLVDALGPPRTTGERLLLVQAEVARAALLDGMTDLGWRVNRVVGYRTVDAEPSADEVDAARGADAITFTSSSTVERFVRLAGVDAVPPVVISIGPVTSATAADLGLSVTAEADPHTLDGLVDAVVDWAAAGRPQS